MRYLLLSLVVLAGCQVFTPAEAQRYAQVLHDDAERLRAVAALLSTSNPLHPKVITALDTIAANASALDTILNK